MPLWRVDVAGVSYRFVDAPSKTEATARVRDSLIKALELTATAVPRELNAAYSNAGPVQRARLIASLDGLSEPHRPDHSIKKQIERLQNQLSAREKWIDEALTIAPELSPERMARIARIVEDGRLSQERAYRRVVQASIDENLT